jgi:plasmid maintenance system antidote protein VapI
MTDTSAPAVAEQPTGTTAAEAGTTQSTPANASETLLTGKEEAGNQEGQPATEDIKAEDKPADEGSEAKADVPEAYEFKFAEGLEVDPSTLGELSDVAKELKLTQEQAQRIADLGAKQSERWLQAQQEVMAKAEEQWLETVQTDKEIGGDKLSENVAVALKAIETFGSPELKAFLKESRLGNHPEMIRFAYRAGKAIANDSVVPGGRSTNGERKPLYDNSDHR